MIAFVWVICSIIVAVLLSLSTEPRNATGHAVALLLVALGPITLVVALLLGLMIAAVWSK